MKSGNLLSLTLLWLGTCTLAFTEEVVQKIPVEPQCKDAQQARATINPKLDHAFFATIVRSYPWYVTDHGDGQLEDTLDGKVDPEDRIQVEHTANCISDHLGKHTMEFCDVSKDGQTTILRIWGGLPAYASSLTLKIAADLKVNCNFKASYPAPRTGIAWRITKKTIQLRNPNAKAGERLYGWLSVEFEERSEQEGRIVWTPHKIEGYIKPLMPRPTANKAAHTKPLPAPSRNLNKNHKP